MASSTDSLNFIYAQEMRNHPYGYALFTPTLTSIIKPGVVGFFDSTGFWSPLADLTDPQALVAAGLKPPRSKLRAAPDQRSTWGVMTSKSTVGKTFNANPSIGPAATGLPLNASVQIKYESTSSFGAVLVTSSPVTHSAFYYQSPFSDWIKDNARALLAGQFKEDIQNHGLVVVTQTYSTTKCALTAWTEGKGSCYLGFDAELPGLGKLDPKGSWIEGNSASGWVGYERPGTDDVVVFLGGLWYDCRKEGFAGLFSSRFIEPEGQRSIPSLGNKEDVKVNDDKGQDYQLHCQIWGEPLSEPRKLQRKIMKTVLKVFGYMTR